MSSYQSPTGSGTRLDKRPFGIQLDVESLNRRRAVSQILSGGAFKDELESILKAQISGPQKRSVVLRKLQETVIPASALEASRQSATPLAPPLHHVGELIIPINDLRGSNATKYTIPERQLRCKLASVCRLSDLFGWSSLVHNLVTGVCSVAERSVLANAFGLMCYEVTASNLVKVGFEGDILDHGGTQFGIEHTTLPLHLAIYAARQDIRCIIPVINSATVAVSCMSCGLLGISEKAIMVGTVSYTNPYEDIDLDPASKILFVHGQGLLALGHNVEEAFHYAYHAARACEIQVSAIAAGIGNLSFSGMKNELRPVDLQREFEGLMRMLDNKGYNTGYEYKCWDLFQPPPDANYEVRKKEREAKRVKVQLKKKDTDCYPSVNNTTSPLLATESAQSQTQACEAGFTEQESINNVTAEAKPFQQHGSRLKDFTNVSEQLNTVPMVSRRAADQTLPDSNKRSDYRFRAEVNEAALNTKRWVDDPFVKPLERAMNAAEQVAHSTHRAVERLNLQGPHGQEVGRQPYQSSSEAVKAITLKSETTALQYPAPGPLSSNGYLHSPAFHEGDSRLHTGIALFSGDHKSAERAANAARIVAKHTAEAMRKISGSLKEPVPPYFDPL